MLLRFVENLVAGDHLRSRDGLLVGNVAVVLKVEVLAVAMLRRAA